jgi:hypothetical protein
LSELCGPIPMKVITPVRDARQQWTKIDLTNENDGCYFFKMLPMSETKIVSSDRPVIQATVAQQIYFDTNSCHTAEIFGFFLRLDGIVHF